MDRGRVAERLNAPVLKTRRPENAARRGARFLSFPEAFSALLSGIQPIVAAGACPRETAVYRLPPRALASLISKCCAISGSVAIGFSSFIQTRIACRPVVAIAARRDDGTLRDPVTIWVVRLGDDLLIDAVSRYRAR